MVLKWSPEKTDVRKIPRWREGLFTHRQHPEKGARWGEMCPLLRQRDSVVKE